MIEVLILLIVIGALLYIIKLIPLDGMIKQLIYIIVVVFLVIYLLRTFVGGF